MASLAAQLALVVEDGDEYLDALSRLAGGPRWVQARSAAAAVAAVATQPIAVVVLDMRFDRAPRASLAGDHSALTVELAGDAERAWRHLAMHQGLYVLDRLRASGWAGPIVIAYDFSREPRRFATLAARSAPLRWIGDDATAARWLDVLTAAVL